MVEIFLALTLEDRAVAQQQMVKRASLVQATSPLRQVVAEIHLKTCFCSLLTPGLVVAAVREAPFSQR
jgi:hypothetical protein